MVMGSFGRSQGRAKRRLNETIFLKGKNPECFKLYSIHLIPLAELDSNLIGGGDGFPVLDDDDDDGDGYPPFGNRKAPQGA